MNNLEEEIKLINSIIEEAVDHGGDSGGPYFCNHLALREAVLNWLCFRGIVNKSVFSDCCLLNDEYYEYSYDIRDKVDYCQIVGIDEINNEQKRLTELINKF